MLLSPNTILGRYEVLSQLGAGGMGEVYLAHDAQLNRQVALKVLPADLINNRECLRRFEQEAKAASALNHPNIITIYEVGQWNDTHFIANEFVAGVTLRQRLNERQLELNEALDIATQITSALATTHAAGIVHRDIKPENIMMRDDGLVKVLDFGIAKLVKEETPALDTEAPTKAWLHTTPGMVMGTAGYMSPEQARGREVDQRTDIWSLGVVLYEVVTGHSPFEGETQSDVIASILKSEPPPFVHHTPGVPRELEHIVSKALRKDREERYQHIKDLLIDLKVFKQELEFAAKLERSVPPNTRSHRELRQTVVTDAGQTGGASDIHTTSSAEYIVNGIKQHKRRALLILATLLVATSVAYYAYSRNVVGSDKAGIDSIAILPFANATGDPNTEYLSDGISESLINNLSQLSGMKVIARSSAFKYKGKEADPQEAARALGVDTILTGRVLQRGESLLITVELMDARDNTQVWGAHYDRRATDLLAVQSEISGEIAEKLRLRLTAGEQQQLAKRETTNPTAYELMLRGRFYRDKAGKENRKKAIE
ncbi:MAG: serine/threonine-protein kinase, partial [Acidobacteriota bacterium]|nr:serine/threonine-protein kinase [Acidobacteriota bacterium]